MLAPMVSLAYDRPRVADRAGGAGLAAAGDEARARRRRDAAPLRHGSVTVLGPGPEDLGSIGANLMDPRRRQAVLATALRTSVAALRGRRRPGPSVRTGTVG